jgi:hypothetical protein
MMKNRGHIIRGFLKENPQFFITKPHFLYFSNPHPKHSKEQVPME